MPKGVAVIALRAQHTLLSFQCLFAVPGQPRPLTTPSLRTNCDSHLPIPLLSQTCPLHYDRQMSERSRELREQILQLAEKYFEEEFGPKPFFPGQSAVPVAGKVLDAADLRNLIDASLDCWLTTGRFATQFERQFARYLDVRGATLVNSGSSANLLAFSALTSPSFSIAPSVPATRSSPSLPDFPPPSIPSSRTAACRSSSTSPCPTIRPTHRSSTLPSAIAPAPS